MFEEEKTGAYDVARIIAPPDAKRTACFIIVAGVDTGRVYSLQDAESVIGRSLDTQIHLEGDGISRKHAKVTAQSGGLVTLVDLGSTNGTYVNGLRTASHVLKDGDKVQIGATTILKFSLHDAVEETFHLQQYESATRDWLTACFNKRYLMETIPNEASFAARSGRPLSIAMVDIDHFKVVNDNHGHSAGDYVLKATAWILRKSIRAHDLLARYGGEEFVLLMRETEAESAFTTCERLRERISNMRFTYEDRGIGITVSSGIATFTTTTPTSSRIMLRAADECLYRAKQEGRNRTHLAEFGDADLTGDDA